MPADRIKVFFDGGCRPNPGRMEVAVVVGGQAHVFDDLGPGTSEDAEWLALLRALELAQTKRLASFILVGDALEVIRQASRTLATGHARDAHGARLLALAAHARPAAIRWTKRQQNLAGIALASRHGR